MILGPKKLLELVRKIKLVEGLAERELKNPEGAGFDLRLGELYKIKGKAFLGEVERQTPKITLYKSYKTGKKTKVQIKPGQYFLATTIEKVNTPKNLTINFKPRTTTFRSGLILRTGNVAPGYVGKLTFAIKNEGPCNVILEMGCRIVHAQFEEVKGGGTIYRGQWQGGRVTTKQKEKQI
jgi:deoxycytidine triphosphate deaminase